jgi:hypothetical protein
LAKQVVRFIAVLKDPALDLQLIIHWATILAAHVDLLRVGHGQDLLLLCDTILSFLRRGGMHNEPDKLGVAPGHDLLIRMVSQLFRKMPSDDLCRFDVSVPFLGRCGQFCESESVTMRINGGGWWSTGFWLPTGVQCRVTLPRDAQRMRLQIGSHSRDLLATPTPWSRWPSLTIIREITQGELCISTPYGGLIYIVPFDDKPTKAFALEFSEVCVAPCYSYQNSEKWEETTVDADCPWAEIQSKYVTFTLQTDVAVEIPSIPDAVAMITEFIESIYTFMGVPDGSIPARVVFDVGLPPPGIVLGYPIFVDDHWAEVIFQSTGVTARLLQFMASLSVRFVSAPFFPPLLRGILALLAATFAMSKRWSFNPAALLPHLDSSPLWSTLSTLLPRVGFDPFAGAIARVRGRASTGPVQFSEAAEIFVTTLAQRAKRVITGLFDLVMATETSEQSELMVIHGIC